MDDTAGQAACEVRRARSRSTWSPRVAPGPHPFGTGGRTVTGKSVEILWSALAVPMRPRPVLRFAPVTGQGASRGFFRCGRRGPGDKVLGAVVQMSKNARSQPIRTFGSDQSEGQPGELTSAEREELRRLRKENREQQQTIEKLKKATLDSTGQSNSAG
ncbi:hypothetical protein SCAB_0921 [Streptomyces scabiei 87.22]|uniref:Transposase n=2 Tax=Streptomyces TaxID=1883 RepID=C9ZCT9_STRSW|nr:hypothetical protein SCAB_0921 [Streptomyces scabiei 87.22]